MSEPPDPAATAAVTAAAAATAATAAVTAAVAPPSVVVPPSSSASTVSNLASPEAPMKPRPPKKKKNNFIREQFRTPVASEAGKPVEYWCNHCAKQIYKWTMWNASKATGHIMQCTRTPEDVKEEAKAGTQASKKIRKILEGVSHSVDGSVSSESQASLREMHARKSGAEKKADPRTFLQTAVTSFGSVMNKDRAECIIRAEVEAILARFEPISRILDPIVQSSLSAAHGPALLQYIPSDASTLFSGYVIPIDAEVTANINVLMTSVPGSLNMAVDGITIQGQSHLLYMVSKGSISLFEKCSQLGDSVHVTDAEANDGVEKLEGMVTKYRSPVASVAVDNAAITAVKLMVQKYGTRNPDAPPAMVTRDPAHCIDLLSKDSAKTEAFKPLLQGCKLVIEFVNDDRINAIIQDIITKKGLDHIPKVSSFPETRFYLAGDTIDGCRGYKPVLDLIREWPAYQAYYNERDDRRKEKLNKVLNMLTPEWYLQLHIGGAWFGIFKHANKIASSDKMPMSAYFPTCQAMRNELNAVYNGVGNGGHTIVSVFGATKATDLADFIRHRFNMNGAETPGRKVGLLDSNQIWSYMVDPYKNRLPHQIVFLGGLPCHLSKMLEFFVPDPPIDNQDVNARNERGPRHSRKLPSGLPTTTQATRKVGLLL
jgi:hypothetical protein